MYLVTMFSNVDPSETERLGILFIKRPLKDVYNDLIQYKSFTFPDYSHVLDVLAHIHMPSLENLVVKCCKLSAKSLGKFYLPKSLHSTVWPSRYYHERAQ